MSDTLALVVEDERDLGVIFSEAVLQAGFSKVELATTGADALRYLEKHVPDLVILDLHLPEMNGGQVLRWIKNQSSLAKCLVVLATADAAFANTLEDQADFVLQKPVSFSQLRDLSARLLNAIRK